MDFRHEIKHEIGYIEMLSLRQRLKEIMSIDSHTINGKYKIRSLYFDNIYDKALKEKIDGVNYREKFRIRYYNFDTSFIVLEKKSKINGLCKKDQVVISKDEADELSRGITALAKQRHNELLDEFCSKIDTELLRAKTIVDYTREPFVYAPGNVRITFDYDIRTALRCTEFFNPNCVTVPAGDKKIILEVKWDEFLPGIIRNIVEEPKTHSTAFSKYAVCRIYD